MLGFGDPPTRLLNAPKLGNFLLGTHITAGCILSQPHAQILLSCDPKHGKIPFD